MSTIHSLNDSVLERRARQSQGISSSAIYEMVAEALNVKQVGGVIVDVGCGEGNLWPHVKQLFNSYIGVDAIRYNGFPQDAQFSHADLDSNCVPLEDGIADVVAAVETIEHLENPRAFVRELVRLVKPGGWVVITTPNQMSLLSLMCLIVKRRFSAFQDVHYPAHITALLEVDLVRIASESHLQEVKIAYSLHGRIVLTPWHHPKILARFFPRALSDNMLLIGRKPLD